MRLAIAAWIVFAILLVVTGIVITSAELPAPEPVARVDIHG